MPPRLPGDYNPRELTVLAIALSGVVTSAGGATAKRTAEPAATPSPCGRTTVAPAHYQHVVVIVMENKQYSNVIGDPNAPFPRPVLLTTYDNRLVTPLSYNWNLTLEREVVREWLARLIDDHDVAR